MGIIVSLLEYLRPDATELIDLSDGSDAVLVRLLLDVTADIFRLSPFDVQQPPLAEMDAVSPAECTRGFDVREAVVYKVAFRRIGDACNLQSLQNA